MILLMGLGTISVSSTAGENSIHNLDGQTSGEETSEVEVTCLWTDNR